MVYPIDIPGILFTLIRPNSFIFIDFDYYFITAVKVCRLPASTSLPINYKEHKESDINDMLIKIRHVNISRGIQVQPDAFVQELRARNENPSGMPILITPYCSGGNLRHQLNDHRNACGMRETDVRTILMALKNAIFYLHSLSIVHRDLKPESVVIELTADGQRIYKVRAHLRISRIKFKFLFLFMQLTDAGNSKPLDVQCAEMSKTMAYTAPESIINGSEKCGPAVDYWSFGTIAYELVTGVRPFVPHLPLAQWMLRVRGKKSEHISIYETNDGEMVYSNRIWPSNQLSSGFVAALEQWLRLALEWNPKQRGCVFEKSRRNSNDQAEQQTAPVQVLKFFDTIDEVLAQKLLTIFTLSNHKWISMPVTERTTMDDLNAFVERHTAIPAGAYHLTSTVEGQTRWNCCEQPDKPIDFYRDDDDADDCTDRPMIFVTQSKSIVCDDDAADNSNIFPTTIPITVQNVLKNPEKPLKCHSLERFARDALHFIRMENRKYQISLSGWFRFAEQSNHAIEQCEAAVRQMQSSIYGLVGALDLFKMTMKMARDQQSAPLIAHEFGSVTKIAQNSECLKNACDKIALRYHSLCRRCRELCQHEWFAKRNVHNFYDTTTVAKVYATLCSRIARDTIPMKPHFELFKCIFKCLKQRDHLLRNSAFCELKR